MDMPWLLPLAPSNRLLITGLASSMSIFPKMFCFFDLAGLALERTFLYVISCSQQSFRGILVTFSEQPWDLLDMFWKSISDCVRLSLFFPMECASVRAATLAADFRDA